jgi:FdhD protein
MPRAHEGHPVRRYEHGTLSPPRDDRLAAEEPLEIRVNGRAISVTMRTPGHDEELAVGFLVGEGLLKGPTDVDRVRRCPDDPSGNVIDVLLRPDAQASTAALSALTRTVFTTSSCGLCGLASIDAVRKNFPPLTDASGVTPQVLLALPETLRAAQSTFDQTGGLHAAGLFDPDGGLLVSREDVGRHNAVDKVVGHELLRGAFPLSARILVVSGRASFEIIQKAAAARIPIVAAVSAPSSLAADLAEETNITLVGFLRAGRFNVYTRAERVGTP